MNWTSATDRYTTVDAGYGAEKIVFVKPFNIESTGQRATLADLESPTVLIPAEGTLHTVTYMVDNNIYEQLEVAQGDCAENLYYQPADKLFDAWYKEGASEPWNFETPIVQDLTLVAKYKNITLNTDETGAYLIGTADEWDAFAVMVYNGTNEANAKLTADITQPVTRMIGTENCPYSGTFDGQNHTLTINYKSFEYYAAPFSRVSKATIQNLKVAGTITAYQTYASGMCGFAEGVTITNCTSSVTIDSKKVDFYIFTGGFLAFAKNNTTTLTNCIFDGKMLGENDKACAGFVADRTVSTPVYVSYCYFIPEELTVSDSESRTICRFDPTSMTNCYYTKKLGTAQGKIMAQMIPDERVTINGTPTLTHKGINYWADGEALNLNYDLPNGKFFDRYTVNDGNISNQYVMTGEHVVSGFTNNVTITGHHVDSKISLLDATIEAIPDTTYNKLAIEPELHVTLGDALLVKGEDYAVEFSDNINVGIATATIFGIGIYCDTTTVNFNILPRNINDEVITVACPSKFHYTGETVHPVPTISYGDYKLVADTDFELAYDDDCITIGDYNITVTGKSNYTGTKELPFTIMDEVIYREYDGEFFNAICGNFQTLFNQTALNEGWWVVAENATINERITVTGDVHIILMDGVTLTAPKGIAVNKNNGNSTNALTIYAQSDGNNMGKIIINDVPQGCAGIGGDDRTHFNVVTINGGDLDITSGSKGAAIGSGSTVYSSAGTVIINGGKLMLRPNSYGAAIGGGEYSSGGTIIINGGDITAIGGSHSAGIGGCDGYNGGNITINGGIINATGNTRSAAIGGGGYWSTSGSGGRSGTITINGGQITANPGNNSTIAIGAAMNSTSPTSNDKITLSWTDATNDYITANGAYEGDTIIFEKQFYLQGTTTFATCDNIANATIVPALPIEETSTLAQVLEGNNGNSYLIGDNLAVAAVNADYAVLTDGNDWIKVTGSIGQLQVNDVITSILGTLIIDEAGNPRFSFNNYVESEETVDWQIAKMSLATITEEDLASIESGQVVTFIGYYDYANEALRGWKTAPQGVSISLNTSRVGAPDNGAYLEVTGMITFKEAWDEQGSGAPKRVQRTGDATFQNLTLDAHSTTEAEYPTGIHNIMVDDRNVEGIYDLRGIKVTNPDKGIYIIRYNDGTAKKVRF